MEPRMSIATLTVLGEMLKNPYAEHYGLEISKATKMPSGSLYPILTRLEQHGWLTGHWEKIDPVAESRRPRKYYKFTTEGLSKARAAIDKMKGTLNPGGLTHA